MDDSAALYELLIGSPSIRPTESPLLIEWFMLQRTFPRDGYEGAAQLRADHHKKVLQIEWKLRDIHERTGHHGPSHRIHGKPTGKCVCGVSLPDLKPKASDVLTLLRESDPTEQEKVRSDLQGYQKKPVPHTTEQLNALSHAIIVATSIIESTQVEGMSATDPKERDWCKEKAATWSKTLAWWKGHRDSGRIVEGLLEAQKFATHLHHECYQWLENTGDPSYQTEGKLWKERAEKWRP